MHRRTRRGNRLGLALVGVVLILGAAAVLSAHFGVLGPRAAMETLYPGGLSDWIGQHRWSYWGIAVLMAIVALLCLRWLLVQLRTDRVGRISVDSDRHDATDAGITTVVTAAVVDAVTTASERLTGVRSTSAAVSGHRDAPELWLTITLAEDADSGAVRRVLQDSVLRDVRAALEMPDLPVYLTLDVSRGHLVRSRG